MPPPRYAQELPRHSKGSPRETLRSAKTTDWLRSYLNRHPNTILNLAFHEHTETVFLGASYTLFTDLASHLRPKKIQKKTPKSLERAWGDEMQQTGPQETPRNRKDALGPRAQATQRHAFGGDRSSKEVTLKLAKLPKHLPKNMPKQAF